MSVWMSLCSSCRYCSESDIQEEQKEQCEEVSMFTVSHKEHTHRASMSLTEVGETEDEDEEEDDGNGTGKGLLTVCVGRLSGRLWRHVCSS